MDNEHSEPKHSSRVAIIGLIGTILTACGGLAGAIIGGGVTIYKTNLEAQQLAIAAPQSDQPLSVDTRKVAINSSSLSNLESSKYLALPDLGFVMAQPQPGWNGGEQMSYYDLFTEFDINLSPLILFYRDVKDTWDDQPVRQLRYAEPVMVQYIEGSTENGVTVDPTQLTNDTIAFYSQFTVLALDKALAQQNFTLYDLALTWGGMHLGGINNLVANPDSQYVFEQVSWELKGVRVNDRSADLTLQRWALFAEGPEHYYIVEVQYVPAEGQSMQVWDDIQTYLDAFRVIQ